jgi:endoglucanase
MRRFTSRNYMRAALPVPASLLVLAALGCSAADPPRDGSSAQPPVSCASGDCGDQPAPVGAAVSRTKLAVLPQTKAAPQISSFSPSNGAIGSGLTITGSAFTGATAVWIGSAHDAAFSVVSATEIKVTVPADAPLGAQQLAVIMPGAAAFSTTNFSVLQQAIAATEISSLSPSNGAIGSGLTITGSAFTGATAVWIGSAHDAAFSVVSASEIKVTVPADAPLGAQQLAVIAPGGAGFSGSDFTVQARSGSSSGSSSSGGSGSGGSGSGGSGSSSSGGSASGSSNSGGSGSGSSSSGSASTGGSSSGGSLVVKVSGNKLIDGSGKPLQLRGANMSGLEFVGVQGGTVSTWGGTMPSWPLFKTWGANAVRIPLNVGSWLGLTTYTAHGQPATSFGSEVIADPQGNYKQTVISAVAAAQASGFYVILDLHWSAPRVTLAGNTQYITPDGQPEFMNSSTDIPFWTSIAQTFGTQATPSPGVSNAGVVFELFNEPYIDYYASGSTLYGLMLNGGTVSKYTWAVGAYSVSPTGGVGIAGYQQALNAIRGAGANNVCIVNGPSWAQEGQNYKQWFPTDTLSPPQLAAGWHPYPNGTYPYSNGDVYGQIGSDTGAGTASFAQWFQVILNNGTPVIITEDGGEGGTSATSGEPHMAYMESWADAQFASYIAWEWTEPQTYGTAVTNDFLTAYGADGQSILPTEGAGVTLYNWLLSR